MRFASLGSGSGGNALLVEAGATRILLDCGLSAREAEQRLARFGLAPADLAGVIVTHEHDDHVGGVFAFTQRHDLRAWMTFGTMRATLEQSRPKGAAPTDPLPEVPTGVIVIDSHSPFAIGDLEVHPVPVPHDAREPVQFVLSDGDRRLGVLTDVGTPTAHIVATLSGVDALVLECNHDATMLARGPYPGWLKARVGGAYGHLSNGQAAEILARIDRRSLKHVIAAHLSEANNRPELATAALAEVLGCAPDWIGVASQTEGFDWRSL